MRGMNFANKGIVPKSYASVQTFTRSGLKKGVSPKPRANHKRASQLDDLPHRELWSNMAPNEQLYGLLTSLI